MKKQKALPSQGVGAAMLLTILAVLLAKKQQCTALECRR